ncbi:hypothetical protein NUW54_g8895 [Trametes sanguinea]|uniref:Uncharacterized protein n=1 Tax=Trametes sanguinea TaxID=158606 RepID=A0ACC1PD47_9APHY|nr:hypothetical protein NUW54_g8895 [Trametes sanguinea]
MLGCVGLKAPNIFARDLGQKQAANEPPGGTSKERGGRGREREILLTSAGVSPLWSKMSVATQSMPPPPTPGLNGDASNGQPGADGANGVQQQQPQPKFASGLILPPPEIKSVIDRTAQFVARSANPPQFEDKIRENQRGDPKFAFLNPADPYHAYYRHRMEKVVRGELEEVAPGKEEKATAEWGEGRWKDLLHAERRDQRGRQCCADAVARLLALTTSPWVRHRGRRTTTKARGPEGTKAMRMHKD